jgi:hypothetical protein
MIGILNKLTKRHRKGTVEGSRGCPFRIVSLETPKLFSLYWEDEPTLMKLVCAVSDEIALELCYRLFSRLLSQSIIYERGPLNCN